MKLTYLVILTILLVILPQQGSFGKKKKQVQRLHTKPDGKTDLHMKGLRGNWVKEFRKKAKKNTRKPSRNEDKEAHNIMDASPPRGAIDRMKTEFNRMTSAISDRTDAAAIQLRKLVNRTKSGLISLDTRWNQTAPERRSAIVGALNTAASKLSSFKDAGTNPMAAFRGAIEIAATFANLAGPHGVIVGVALNFISGFLSLFGQGDSPTPMYMVVREEIEKLYSRQLTSEAQGAIGDFEISQAFLDGVITALGPDERLDDDDASDVQINIPVYRNVNFMETLKSEINNLKEANRAIDADKCLNYIELYARMALLKDIILQRVASIMPESKAEIRSGLYSVQQSLRTKARNALKFLWEAEIGNNIIPFFDPEKNVVVDEYLSTVLNENNYDRSMTGKYKIFVEVESGLYGMLGYQGGVPPVGDWDQMANVVPGNLQFTWKLVPHGNNLFTILCQYNCPDGIFCGEMLSWTEDHAYLKRSDPVLWEITRSGGGYRIRNKTGCNTSPPHAKCNAELKWEEHGDYRTGRSWLAVLLTQSGGMTWYLRRA